MQSQELLEIATQIEMLPTYDAALTRRAFELVARKLPDVDRDMIEAGALGTVDAVLLLIDHGFPGWTLSMDGVASEQDGHWKCSLRQSAVLDNDAYLGVGKGPKLSNAMIGTLLKALAQRPNE